MLINTSDMLLNEEELAGLRDRMGRIGEARTAESLRLSRMTLLRLLARQPVRLGSISLARIGLAKGV